MAEIVAGAGYATFINTFGCEPSDQDEVVRINVDIVDQVASTFPGFISATVHRSTDGTRVIGSSHTSATSSTFRTAPETGRATVAQGSRAWPIPARRAPATCCPAAWAAECPVTVARNASRWRAYSWESTVAVTVAVRGTSRSSAISPK
jgi:hypothetical protein